MPFGRKYEVVAYGPKFIYQGETGYFQFYHYSSGTLADATSDAKVTIKCISDGQTIVASTTDPAKPAGTTGYYTYAYNASATAQVGWYTCQGIFSNTGSDVNKEGVIHFQVLEDV